MRAWLLAALLCLAAAAPAAAFLLHATPGSSGTATGTAPCDTITVGCQFAYSMSQKLVGSYSGNAFELVNETPDWVGTGTVAAGVLTVVSTTSGTPTVGEAISTPASGAVYGFKPVTYITGGSGPYTLSDNSVTISSATAMATYPVRDEPFTAGVWNDPNWRSFCYNTNCGVLKIFNQGAATATGTLTGTDLVTLESNYGGGGNRADCSPNIVVCAPLFVIYTPTNSPVALAHWPAVMSMNGGFVAGTTVTDTIAGTGNKSNFIAGLNTTGTGGGFGKGDLNPSSTVNGTMYGVSFAVSGTTLQVSIDYEGNEFRNSYDSGQFSHGAMEVQYTNSTNLFNELWNGAAVGTTGTPTFTLNTSHGFINLGSGGDYTAGNVDFELGFLSADSSSHVSAYNAIANTWAATPPAACTGPIDLTWYQDNEEPIFQKFNPDIVGMAKIAYSLRPLSAWYTGPIVNVTNAAAQTKTFSAIGCNIDPAMQAFCTGGNSPCSINTLYSQAYNFGVPPNGTIGNTRPSIGFDLTQTGAARPTVDYTNTLGGQPTIAANGSQYMCTSVVALVQYAVQTSVAQNYDVIYKRTGSFTSNQTWFGGLEGGNLNVPLIHSTTSAGTVQMIDFTVTSGTIAATDNQWHSVDLQKNAGGVGGDAYVDGTAASVSWVGSSTSPTQYCMFSDNASGGTPATGNIAQVVGIDDTALANLAGSIVDWGPAILSNSQAYYGVTFPH